MKIDVEESNKTFIKFTLSDTPVSFANSLRRVLLSEISTLSIDMVEMEKNYTVLPDEMVAHRLGLIPIYSRDLLKDKSECRCTGYCDECAIVGELDVCNRGDGIKVVTSDDIDFGGRNMIRTTFPSIIVKLASRQSIKAKLIIRKGTAQMHAKWCPVTAVGFEYDSENRTMSTDYWYEKDARVEWPDIVSTTPTFEECRTIHMNFEVVEGVIEPLNCLISALEILKEKVSGLVRMIEVSGIENS